jgi:GNAT superfamily N-acetyltransferase
MKDIRIRKALPGEADVLTKVSFSAKSYWGYPEVYFQIWKDELTVTPAYIEANIVHVAEIDEQVVGYYSVVENKQEMTVGTIMVEKGLWLDHMFILPKFMGMGIGTALVAHMRQYLTTLKIDRIVIFVDPYAKGFYEKMGAVFRRESDSSIKGRRIPVYEMKIGKHHG